MNETDQKFTLDLFVDKKKEKSVRHIIQSLFSWINPRLDFIQINKQRIPSFAHVDSKDGWYQPHSHQIPSPAIAVMLFVSENGSVKHRRLQDAFTSGPWILHHSVELKKKAAPEVTIARQRFYQLSPELPLWCVCPAMEGEEHVRVNIFVVNYRKMVEFYRLVTDSEMESSKPGFCIFQVKFPNDTSIQLSLKHCPSLQPQRLRRAVLNFRIRKVDNYKSLIKSDIKEITKGRYSVLDPDGNCVQLIDVDDDTETHSKDLSLSTVALSARNKNSLSIFGRPRSSFLKKTFTSRQPSPWEFYERASKDSISEPHTESPLKVRLCDSVECSLCGTPKQNKRTGSKTKDISVKPTPKSVQKPIEAPQKETFNAISHQCPVPSKTTPVLQDSEDSWESSSFTEFVDSDSDLTSISNVNKPYKKSTGSSGFCETEEESEFEDPLSGSQFMDSDTDCRKVTSDVSKTAKTRYKVISSDRFYIFSDECYPPIYFQH